MPIFIDVIEDIGISPNLKELNAKLKILQQKGAKIVDIKMSIAHGEHITRSRETYRTYLIIYEAEKPLA